MIEKIAEHFAHRIAKITGEENRINIYCYGLEIILNTSISMLIVIGLGFVMQKALYAMFYLFSYCSIRLWAGGYHADSNKKCIFMFVVFFICCVVGAKIIIISNMLMICLLFIENIILLLLSPVGAINNPIPKGYERRMKLKAILSGIIVTCIIIALDNNEMEMYGIFGISWVVFLLIIGKIQMKRRKIYEKKGY